MEWYSRVKMKEDEVDQPEEIIKGVVEQRKKLLSGFGGNKKVKKEIFEEAYNKFPSHWAISLSGEPTIYPKLGEMIKLLKQNKEVKSVFVVSNGQNPEVFEKWEKEGTLPTQLYISLAAPNEELFKKINRSVYKDGWQRLMKTITQVLKKLSCRRVIRLTLIKGLNDRDEYLESYGEILEKSHADFIEIKAYMYLGMSRKRLKEENMPSFEEVKAFSKKLLKFLPSYKYENEDKSSRIVLLKRVDSPYENIIKGSEAALSLKKVNR